MLFFSKNKLSTCKKNYLYTVISIHIVNMNDFLSQMYQMTLIYK